MNLERLQDNAVVQIKHDANYVPSFWGCAAKVFTCTSTLSGPSCKYKDAGNGEHGRNCVAPHTHASLSILKAARDIQLNRPSGLKSHLLTGFRMTVTWDGKLWQTPGRLRTLAGNRHSSGIL